MEPTSNNLPPSHHLLLQLGLLVSLDKDKGEKPQILSYRHSTDLKIHDHSKSVFESWTSGEDWYNWISWQQPGLLGLPTLLAKTISELKSEFNQAKPGDPNLKMTISELEVAESGLDHLREFDLDLPTQKIIAGALQDIQKLQLDFKNKLDGKLSRKMSNPENFYTPPSAGLSYYIPQNIAARFESAETKNMREAFEVVEKLKKVFKDDETVSPTLLKNLQFIMGDNVSGQNLKNYVISCLKSNDSAFYFNPVNEAKLSEMGFSESECEEIKNFTYQLAEKTFGSQPETTKTLLKLCYLSDNQFPVRPQYVDSLNIVFARSESIQNQFDQFTSIAQDYKNFDESELKNQVMEEYKVLEKLIYEDEATNSIAFQDVKQICRMMTPVDLLLSRFEKFVDPSYSKHFHDEKNGMYAHTLASINTPEGCLEFNQLFDDYHELITPLSMYLTSEDTKNIAKSTLIDYLKESVEEYAKIESDLKIIGQFKADVKRGQAMLREDPYFGILDLNAVPSPLSIKQNELDPESLVLIGSNAIEELCHPKNEHNQLFIPLIQMAASQTSLNAIFMMKGMLLEPGSKYTFENGTDRFNWTPELSDGSRLIKIQVIRNPDTHDIEKIRVKVQGGIDIIEQQMTNATDDHVNPIVAKDVITGELIYDIGVDEKGNPLLTNFSLNYELSLK